MDLSEIRGRLDGIDSRLIELFAERMHTVAEVAAVEGYIQPEDVARLLKFRDNPSDESWIGGKA